MQYKTILVVALFGPVLAFGNICKLASGAYPVSATYYGPTNCDTGQLDKISVVGPLNLNGTTIGTVSVVGPAEATSANIQNLSIEGTLKASGSQFGTITITGNVYLDSSMAQTIIIKGAPDFGQPVLYLSEGSRISGNVVFEKGGGLIVASGGSQVLGTVTGASIENQ